MTYISDEEYNGYTITISYDEYTDFEEYVSNYDGMFATFSPVKLDFPEHYDVHLDNAFDHFDQDLDIMRRYLAIFHPEYTVFPLYSYEHGLTRYYIGNAEEQLTHTRGYRSFDTSAIGYIAMKDHYHFDTPDKKKAFLDSIMEEFTDVTNGHVYAYTIEHPVHGYVMSSSGFIGDELDALDDAYAEADYHATYILNKQRENGTYEI